MSIKFPGFFERVGRTVRVAPAVREFDQSLQEHGGGRIEELGKRQREQVNQFYNLLTDFLELWMGRSFHFAPRAAGESYKASLARHEHYLAHSLGLRPGMTVADIGCGIGGPLIEISRFTGANIVGINSNEYQIERAKKLTEEAGLSHLSEYKHCDFLDIDIGNNSFDAAYAIESTCYAPDKPSVYGEVFRTLKPGACFSGYEFCVTDRFDASNSDHLRLKEEIERGAVLVDIARFDVVDDALRAVGFEVLETRDVSLQPGPSIPWYQPMVGTRLPLSGLRSSRIGRSAMHYLVRMLEAIRIMPRGAARVTKALNLSATAMVEAGRLGIFTPMYFFLARKPA